MMSVVNMWKGPILVSVVSTINPSELCWIILNLYLRKRNPITTESLSSTPRQSSRYRFPNCSIKSCFYCKRAWLREEKDRWIKSSETKCYKGFECWEKAACSMTAEPHYIHHYTWLCLNYVTQAESIFTTSKSFICFFICNTQKCTTTFDFLRFTAGMQHCATPPG